MESKKVKVSVGWTGRRGGGYGKHMAQAKSFRELVVWQKSIDLTAEIYRLTSKFPQGERYGLTSQMCRAAVSIASNIAEGSGRRSKRDFRNFISIAKGSCNELQTQLVIAQRLGYAARDDLRQAEVNSMEVGRMLQGLALFLSKQITAAKQQTGEVDTVLNFPLFTFHLEHLCRL